MARRVFSAGFVWSVIDQKWPGFERPSSASTPSGCCFSRLSSGMTSPPTKRIVRNPQKIKSVRENAKVRERYRSEHGSFASSSPHGRRRSDRPDEVLAKRGSRLGGNTRQYLLRSLAATPSS